MVGNRPFGRAASWLTGTEHQADEYKDFYQYGIDQADEADGWGGKDTIFGWKGDDKLWGGDGDDAGDRGGRR